MKYFFLLMAAVFGVASGVTSVSDSSNKIIYLISPPRCLSTAFMRMMEERKDFVIMNEPSWTAYNLTMYNYEDVKHLIKAGSPISYGQVKQIIFDNAQKSNVFVKEISFSVLPFLFEDESLIQNPNVYFVFLIRDPHAALISFYKKQFKNIPIQKFGYIASYQLFQKVKQCGANPPYIIRAEDLGSHPEKVISLFCKHVHIPFMAHALQWDDLGDAFTGVSEWHENKTSAMLHHWHGDAIHSTGFKSLSGYDLDSFGIPTFKEIDTKDRSAIANLYYIMLPYYFLLLDEKEYLCNPFK